MSWKFQYVRGGVAWLCTRFNAGQRQFTVDGNTYTYFDHSYNFTPFNERRVEVPIAHHLLQSCTDHESVLEVGNVLSHYYPVQHEVVDKYERSSYSRLMRSDAETFSSGKQYELIISLSTLEHVGWDERPRDDTKLARTISHLRGLLKPDTGLFFFSAPLGYNPVLDRLLMNNEIGFDKVCYMRRDSWANTWHEARSADVCGAKFCRPYPFANVLALAWLKRSA